MNAPSVTWLLERLTEDEAVAELRGWLGDFEARIAYGEFVRILDLIDDARRAKQQLEVRS